MAIELTGGAVVMSVDPAGGGRIVSLVIAGVERILSKSLARAHEPALYWGCYPMVPWAGRLSHGRIPTPDGEVRLDANLPPSAIHGLGFDKPWEIVEQSDAAIALECELRGLGWPFGGHAIQTLRLGDDHLELSLEVGGYTRAGPAGLGWHPWFTRPPRGDVELRVDASDVLVVDAELVPTGEVRRVTAMEDLRAGPALRERRLDHVYVRARSPAIVRWPDLELRIDYDALVQTVVVYTPTEGFCVEPQTMWPNAPLLAAAGVTEAGNRILEPGETLTARQTWTWRAS